MEIKKKPEIELGGALDFFACGQFIFINNLRYFEYTFDYTDHITEKREKNLEFITNLEFFQGPDSNKSEFIEQSSKYIYSRSLAQISDQTLSALKNNFENRCMELQKIKRAYDKSNPEEQVIIKRKYKEIWPLFDFIDLESRTIKYDSDKRPITLIHFFADKIVRSFLTQEFKVAAAYETVS